MDSIVEIARVIVDVCAKSRGGSPGFTPFHVVKALKLLSREPLGRISLSSKLGIGETSARTLIERLESHGLIRKSRAGVQLSESGLKMLELLESNIKVYDINLSELGWSNASLVAVVGVKPPKDLVEVYRIRDYMVAEGCREAIIGGYLEGAPVYPGMPDEIQRIVVSKVPKEAMGEKLLHIIIPSGRLEEAFSGLIRMIAELSTEQGEP